LPFVSVVMPVRNEGGFIARSVGAVLAQTYPAERYEVVVADGLSTDATRAHLAELGRAHPNLRVIDNPGRIVSTGLNAALEVARGDIVIRVDGHCEIAPDYVERCVAHLREPGVQVVGGPLTTVGQTETAEAIAVAMSSRFGVGNAAFRTGQLAAFVDTVAFPAFPRQLLIAAGPFDEELVRNQDDEYNYRLRKMGARMLLAPDVQSRYYSRSSFSSLARQYFQYGFWKVRVMQKHPRQMRPRQFVPPALVAMLTVLGVLSSGLPAARWALGLLVVAYLAAIVAAAAVTARGENRRHFVPLCFAFATLHLGYGTGFLYGLVRFARRWGDRRTRAAFPRLDVQGHSNPAPPAHSL
jgi:succinoglycan biosynthesis protein ExoA